MLSRRPWINSTTVPCATVGVHKVTAAASIAAMSMIAQTVRVLKGAAVTFALHHGQNTARRKYWMAASGAADGMPWLVPATRVATMTTYVYAPMLGVGKRSLDDRASSLRNRNAIIIKTAATRHRKYDIHKIVIYNRCRRQDRHS